MDHRAFGCRLGFYKLAAERPSLSTQETLGAMGGAGALFGEGPIVRALGGSLRRGDARIGMLAPGMEAAFRKSIGAQHIPHFELANLPIFRRLPKAARERIGTGAFMPAGKFTGKAGRALMELLGPESFKKYLASSGGATIGANISVPSLAHELGHATGWRGLIPFQRSALKLGGPIAGMLAGTIGGSYYARPEESVLRSAGRGALIGGGASTVLTSPILAEELRASIRGLRHLKRLGAGKAIMLASRRSMLKALGAYGIAMAVPGIALGVLSAMVGRAYKRPWRRKAEKNEQAAR